MRKAADISSYQGKIDFAKMKAAGVEVVFIRAAFGVTKDQDFDYNWREAKAQGVKRAAYFFFDYQPGAPSAGVQIAFWMSLLENDHGEKPPAIDMEQPNSNWPPLPGRDYLIAVLAQYDHDVRMYLGFDESGLYTNPAGLHHLKPIPDQVINRMYLWIAHYYQNAPDYEPWNHYDAWQYALGKGQGPEYGVESKDIDLDWVSDEFAGTEPPQEDKPMGIYSKRAKVLYLWESHTNVDFSKLKGKVDAVAVLLGSGMQPNVQAKATIKAAHAAGFPVLGYVELQPSCYEGYAFNPPAFPKGEAEPHLKMIHQALHWPDGTAEYVDGFIEDFSRHKMSDGKTWQTDNWNVAVASHVLGQLWAVYKRPIYPLLKPFESDIPAGYLNSGGPVATWLNSLGAVSVVDMATTVEENGVKIPADLEAPTIPFISVYEFWWFAAQLLDGLNAAGVLMLYRDTPAKLYSELGVQYDGGTTPPPPPPTPPGEEKPPATGDLAETNRLLGEILAEMKKANAPRVIEITSNATWTPK